MCFAPKAFSFVRKIVCPSFFGVVRGACVVSCVSVGGKRPFFLCWASSVAAAASAHMHTSSSILGIVYLLFVFVLYMHTFPFRSTRLMMLVQCRGCWV